MLEGLQGTYAGQPVGIKGCGMPKPHRHIPVHGKHLLLLSPQDAPAAMAPKPGSPGQGTEPSPALSRCCQPLDENFPLTLLQEKLPKISPSPSVSGT